MRSVRLALVTSVTCTPPSAPPVRFQMTHVSILPNTASPRSAAALTPSTFSRIHCSFVPEKYVAGGSPVRSHSSWPFRFEGADDPIGSRVLPHDGVVPGAPVLWIPHHGGFALIGDADGGEIFPVEICDTECAGDHLIGARGDLDGIVLHPSGPGQDLRVLDLPPRHLRARGIEHHEPRAGRALIQRSDVACHAPPLRLALLAQGKPSTRPKPRIRRRYRAPRRRCRRRSAPRPESMRTPSLTVLFRQRGGFRARFADRGRARD